MSVLSPPYPTWVLDAPEGCTTASALLEGVRVTMPGDGARCDGLIGYAPPCRIVRCCGRVADGGREALGELAKWTRWEAMGRP